MRSGGAVTVRVTVRPVGVTWWVDRLHRSPATSANRYDGFGTGSTKRAQWRPSSVLPAPAGPPLHRSTGNAVGSATRVTSNVLRFEGRSRNHVIRRKPSGSRLVLTMSLPSTTPLSPGRPGTTATRVVTTCGWGDRSIVNVRSSSVCSCAPPSTPTSSVSRPRPSSTRGPVSAATGSTCSSTVVTTRSAASSTRITVCVMRHGPSGLAGSLMSVRLDELAHEADGGVDLADGVVVRGPAAHHAAGALAAEPSDHR